MRYRCISDIYEDPDIRNLVDDQIGSWRTRCVRNRDSFTTRELRNRIYAKEYKDNLRTLYISIIELIEIESVRERVNAVDNRVDARLNTFYRKILFLN